MNLPLTDGAIVLDNSSLERFTTCPRSAEYYLLRKRETSEPKVALLFGSAIHKALAVRYENEDQNLTGVEPTVEGRQLVALSEAFSKFEVPEGEFRTYDRAVDLVRRYNKEYPTEPFKLMRLNDKPAVEISFALPLGTVLGKYPVIWTGRIDLLVELDGRVWIVDHKTTSILGPSYFKEFYLSGQFLGYNWAARQCLGRPVDGVIVNALGNRKPTKTGTSIEFVRDNIHHLDDLVNAWVPNTLNIISDYVAHAERGFFPQHTKWCVAKYGSCQYFDVCTLPTNQRDTMLNSGLFQDVTWSPLDD